MFFSIYFLQIDGLETYSEIFCVQDDLLPLSLGKKDSNLVEARKLTGITAVEFDKKYNVFSVSGIDRKAVQKARNMLDYIQEDVCIPRTLVGEALVFENAANVYCILYEIECVLRVRIKIE